MTECREAFEAWAAEQWEGRSIPDNAWLGWQAAWAAKQQPVVDDDPGGWKEREAFLKQFYPQSVMDEEKLIASVERKFRPDYNAGTMTAGEMHMIRKTIKAIRPYLASTSPSPVPLSAEKGDRG